jgi:glycosyltransferase involved in cell wall biosynthesis
MRVLMLNRADTETVPGGDTVQMIQTQKGLERLGVDIDLGFPKKSAQLSDYEVIHIFNWQQLGPILAKWPAGIEPDRFVLSPIFWFHTGHWFDSAGQKPVWRITRRLFGEERTRNIFEGWQREKFPWGTEGRTLRRLLRIPKQILPNSQLELDHLENVLGIRAKLRPRSTIVPNGVDRELFDPLPLPNQDFPSLWGNKRFVLEVARIQSAKNQLGLIEALFDLPIPIVFIGQPSPYETEYVNRCYERGKERGNVFFLGPLPHDKIAGIYVQADVHVLPSWRETPGLSSLEAAAAGCRIVTTELGSPRDYFGDLAWYCDPHHQLSVRRAVLDAFDASKSDALRNVVLSRYTWDVAARVTLNAYRLVHGS